MLKTLMGAAMAIIASLSTAAQAAPVWYTYSSTGFTFPDGFVVDFVATVIYDPATPLTAMQRVPVEVRDPYLRLRGTVIPITSVTGTLSQASQSSTTPDGTPFLEIYLQGANAFGEARFGVRTDGRVFGSSVVNGGSIRTSVGNVEASRFLGVAVPEPSSWAMLVVGIGAVGGAARRRRHQSTLSRAHA